MTHSFFYLRILHLSLRSLPGITTCTLSTWLTCRLASSEQQRMFLEREHSLHHSHEMTEKVGLHTQLGHRLVFRCRSCQRMYMCQSCSLVKCFCVSSDRRSWTTPVMAFLRFPTADTARRHHDDALSLMVTCKRWHRNMHRHPFNASCNKYINQTQAGGSETSSPTEFQRNSLTFESCFSLSMQIQVQARTDSCFWDNNSGAPWHHRPSH